MQCDITTLVAIGLIDLGFHSDKCNRLSNITEDFNFHVNKTVKIYAVKTDAFNLVSVPCCSNRPPWTVSQPGKEIQLVFGLLRRRLVGGKLGGIIPG